jgi:hypothetical protein
LLRFSDTYNSTNFLLGKEAIATCGSGAIGLHDIDAILAYNSRHGAVGTGSGADGGGGGDGAMLAVSTSQNNEQGQQSPLAKIDTDSGDNSLMVGNTEEYAAGNIYSNFASALSSPFTTRKLAASSSASSPRRLDRGAMAGVGAGTMMQNYSSGGGDRHGYDQQYTATADNEDDLTASEVVVDTTPQAAAVAAYADEIFRYKKIRKAVRLDTFN